MLSSFIFCTVFLGVSGSDVDQVSEYVVFWVRWSFKQFLYITLSHLLTLGLFSCFLSYPFLPNILPGFLHIQYFHLFILRSILCLCCPLDGNGSDLGECIHWAEQFLQWYEKHLFFLLLAQHIFVLFLNYFVWINLVTESI